MRGQIRGIEDGRKKMRRYSKYFMTYFFWLIIISIVVLVTARSVRRIKKNNTAMHREVARLKTIVSRLEVICER